MMCAVRSWTSLAVLTAFLFAGCASTPDSADKSDYQYEDFGSYEQQPGVTGDGSIRHAIGNPAVVDLWKQAEEARKTGDYDTAELLLERALRIEPDDAVMWSRLAEIHLVQQNANQAENLAAKSNAMSIDNSLLNYRNWLIISRARQMKGDDIGAQEAEYTANSFKP